MENEENYAPIKMRMRKYLKYKGITQDVFFRDAEISSSTFSGKSRESEFGGAILTRIALLYPSLSTRWLLTGVGEMEETETGSTHQSMTAMSNNGVVNHGYHANSYVTLHHAPKAVDQQCQEKSTENSNSFIEILADQCREKDKQIAEKDRQLENLLKTIALLSSK